MNEFSGVYDPIPSVAQYLERIGYSKTPSVSLRCLNELIHCQLHTVPFENLDVYYGGTVPSLCTGKLFEKIVLNHRGGYCFELNGLFCRLLTAIGFDAHCVKVRILLGREIPPPMTHCAILVALNGKRYYCDVGFGGPAPISALELSSKEQVSGNHRYYIENGILYLEHGQFVPMMQFEDFPSDPVDFIPLNYFCAKSEIEPFIHKRMVSIKLPDGHASIDGDVLRILRDEKEEKTILNSEIEVQNALEKWFGITSCLNGK